MVVLGDNRLVYDSIMMTTGNHGWWEVDSDIYRNFYDYNDSCDNIHHRVMIDDIDWWSGLIMERINWCSWLLRTDWIYWWMMTGGHWSWWLIVKIYCWSRKLMMTIMIDDLADYYWKWLCFIMHDVYRWLVIRIDLWWLLIDYDQDWLWLLIMIFERNDCCMVIMDEDWLMMADWDHDW